MRKRFLAIALVCSFTALIALSCSEDETSAPEGITMDEAIDIVINDVIPAEVSQGVSYVCLGMSGSIPKGSTIVEAAPGAGQAAPLDAPGAGRTQTLQTPDPGQTPPSHTPADGQTTPLRAPAASFAVSEESYFFFLDLAPQTFYEHPVKYVVVGKKSGDYAVTDAQWWPKINGETPAQFLAAVPATTHIIAKNIDLETPTGTVKQYQLPPLYTQFSEGFIVVQGLMPDEALFDEATTTYLNGVNFFNSYKNAFSTVEGLVEDQADEVLDTIDEMVNDGKYLITIYIIAHGGIDGVGLGGVWFTAADFYNKMNEHPGVLFNFLLGSCHSGSFVDNLEILDNMRTILTACASDQGAKPDWDNRNGTTDYNTEDSGSEWTSSLLAAMEALTSNTGYWSIIQSNAATHGVPPTSELLCAAGYGCLGANPGFGLTQDLDLSHRTGYTIPQGHCSWEFPY